LATTFRAGITFVQLSTRPPVPKSTSPYPLLERIIVPSDLREIPEAQLDQVCQELRDFIIDVVSVKGGHFGASLGVVELTVALHYVFNTPYDQLVWDVGHQAYGHKILTGRRENFHTNRIHKGSAVSPSAAKASTTLSAWGTAAPPSAARSAWPWPAS
jgi:deoxyxylulose-5-phosphate synthase